MDNVFIGSNVTVMYDVRIGENVIVGANSFVNRDSEGGYVYAGSPARKICSFDEYLCKRKEINYSGVLKSQCISDAESKAAWSMFDNKRK